MAKIRHFVNILKCQFQIGVSVDFGSFTARMSKLLTNPKLSPWFLKH